MKDHRTHLAHKAEHAVDFETGAVVAVTIQDAECGRHDDEHRDPDRSRGASRDGRAGGEGVQELVGDKGYHAQ